MAKQTVAITIEVGEGQQQAQGDICDECHKPITGESVTDYGGWHHFCSGGCMGSFRLKHNPGDDGYDF
jgi:hypothetical protein